MDLIGKVLQSYAVYPLSVEQITDRLFQVNDGKRTYALKRSSLSEQTLKQWERIYQLAHSQNIQTVLPVYLTKEGNLYKEMDQSVFYLTPWITADNNKSQKQDIEQFYHIIGTIHSKTNRSQLIEINKLKGNFSTYRTFCEETKGKLLDYVKQFEKNRYMSPYELLVCTQYRDLEFALDTIMKRIDQFLSDDEAQMTWNDCLCHGNLTLSHVLNPYIINWEQANYENAVLDLATFYENEVVYYDNLTDLFIELFPSYNKINELTLKEHYLLIINLLNPSHYIAKVEEYLSNKSKQTMVNQIKALQPAYRKIIFGLKWSNYVEKEYESIPLDDLES